MPSAFSSSQLFISKSGTKLSHALHAHCYLYSNIAAEASANVVEKALPRVVYPSRGSISNDNKFFVFPQLVDAELNSDCDNRKCNDSEKFSLKLALRSASTEREKRGNARISSLTHPPTPPIVKHKRERAITINTNTIETCRLFYL